MKIIWNNKYKVPEYEFKLNETGEVTYIVHNDMLSFEQMVFN